MYVLHAMHLHAYRQICSNATPMSSIGSSIATASLVRNLKWQLDWKARSGCGRIVLLLLPQTIHWLTGSTRSRNKLQTCIVRILFRQQSLVIKSSIQAGLHSSFQIWSVHSGPELTCQPETSLLNVPSKEYYLTYPYVDANVQTFVGSILALRKGGSCQPQQLADVASVCSTSATMWRHRWCSIALCLSSQRGVTLVSALSGSSWPPMN